MKHSILIAALLIGLSFSACEKSFEWPDADEIETLEMLKGDPWDLDDVASWEMQDGNQTFTTYELFGEGTDNGICTFSFYDDYCIMVDVQDETSEPLTMFDNNQLVIGDEIYTIGVLTETRLELLVGEQEDDADEGEVMRFTRD